MRIFPLLVLAAFGMPGVAQGQTQTAPPPPAPMVMIPILDRAVAKGEVLGAEDFVTREASAAEARGVPRVKDVAGMEALRALSPGAIVRRTDVIRPQLVRRGEPVRIALRDGGLSITTDGRALSSGAAGDLVRAVSLSTNHTIDGIVEGTGAIRVSAR